MEKIYLDYASTTPVDPVVTESMMGCLNKEFGNPSSSHVFGQRASGVLESARETLANFIGAQTKEVIFTSGATEANNQAVFGVAKRHKDKGNHIIVSSIEHPSVMAPVEYLKNEGFKVTYLPVDGKGMVNPDDVRQAISDKTILITVMHASNEIGTVQPIAAIGEIAKEHQIHFHVDAVQAVGHIPVKVNDLRVDSLSLTAHKFYGPKGIGALYVRDGVKISPFLLGGDQEHGLRASTQNIPGAAGLASAVEICVKQMVQEMTIQTKLRNRLIEEIPKRIEGVHLNGHPTERLPNNAHFSFEGMSGESLLMSLDMAGFAASMGSACHSGAMEPSHVLTAINLNDELALGSLRLTVGRWTTEEKIDALVEQLPGMVKALRI